MTPSDVVAGLREQARELGLSSLGITGVKSSAHMDHYRDWVQRGLHGEMGYLAREDAVERRADLAATLPGVRSVIVVTHEYNQSDPEGVPEDPSRGVIARYARGRDYHEVLKKKLLELGRWLEDAVAESPEGLAGGEDARGGAGSGAEGQDELLWRAYVDTGPILERELAQRAGLGWFGKNTMLIHPRRGSYFFLGVLLTKVELPQDEPFTADHCGTCTACLDACPTGALLGRDEAGAPVLDANRCISYLTIENRGAIADELRSLVGNRVFGCDICQEVCPWNERFAETAEEPAYSARPDLDGPELVELADRLLSMSGKGFTREFAGSPLLRAGRKGLLRNVCVALGNWGSEEAVPVLVRALEDPQPLARGHAAWALGRVGSPAALDALSAGVAGESDPFVAEEIGQALGR